MSTEKKVFDPSKVDLTKIADLSHVQMVQFSDWCQATAKSTLKLAKNGVLSDLTTACKGVTDPFAGKYAFTVDEIEAALSPLFNRQVSKGDSMQAKIDSWKANGQAIITEYGELFPSIAVNFAVNMGEGKAPQSWYMGARKAKAIIPKTEAQKEVIRLAKIKAARILIAEADKAEKLVNDSLPDIPHA